MISKKFQIQINLKSNIIFRIMGFCVLKVKQPHLSTLLWVAEIVSIQFGSTIQKDLFSIASWFRYPEYAFSANIAKIFRQILVEESDRDLERIAWKSNPLSLIETFRLRTVSYSSWCAPFWITWTLNALAEDEKWDFTRISTVLITDTCFDDILSGSDNLEKTKSLQLELFDIYSYNILFDIAGKKLHK